MASTGIGEQAPAIWPLPVVALVVVARDRLLLLPVHRLVALHRRAPLHLLLGEIDQDLVAGLAHREGGDQHLTAGQPGAGVDHEIANGPAEVVEEEIGHASEVAVDGGDREALESAGWLEHRAPPCRWIEAFPVQDAQIACLTRIGRAAGRRAGKAYRERRAGSVTPAAPGRTMMIARPSSTNPMPTSRCGPNRSPSTSADDAAATKGTRSAKGATRAAGCRRRRKAQIAQASTVA